MPVKNVCNRSDYCYPHFLYHLGMSVIIDNSTEEEHFFFQFCFILGKEEGGVSGEVGRGFTLFMTS